MTQATPDVRYVKIRDREIAVTELTGTQMVVIGREGVILRKDGVSTDRKLTGFARVLDTFEAAVVEEADREYLVDLMIAGDLELEDLLPIIKAFGSDKAESKPVVRRATRKRS